MDVGGLICTFIDVKKIGGVAGSKEEDLKLQADIDGLVTWAEQWQMEFHLEKSEVMHFWTTSKARELNGITSWACIYYLPPLELAGFSDVFTYIFTSLCSSQFLDSHLLQTSLIYLVASGLNFIDLMVRQGNIENPPKTPLVPGFECSGIVEGLGDNTVGFEMVGIMDLEEAVKVSCLVAAVNLVRVAQHLFVWRPIYHLKHSAPHHSCSSEYHLQDSL
eukprot:g44658.t1